MASLHTTALPKNLQETSQHLQNFPTKESNTYYATFKETKHFKFIIQPTTTLNSDTNNCLDLEIYIDADWAGCPTTRKPTSGFNITLLNTTIAFGSRTQATVALSSAESALYAICTGVLEGLHLRSFLLETNICTTINIRIHTDSTAGKSIATRQG